MSRNYVFISSKAQDAEEISKCGVIMVVDTVYQPLCSGQLQLLMILL